jgi:hypothetical protein
MKTSGLQANDFTALGRSAVRHPDVNHGGDIHRVCGRFLGGDHDLVVGVGLVDRRGVRLGIAVKVILTQPCMFCLENH